MSSISLLRLSASLLEIPSFSFVSSMVVIAHWSIFLMTALQFSSALASLLSQCRHILIMISHSFGELPVSWYDE